MSLLLNLSKMKILVAKFITFVLTFSPLYVVLAISETVCLKYLGVINEKFVNQMLIASVC